MAIAVRAEAEGLGAGCLSPAVHGQHPGLQHPIGWGRPLQHPLVGAGRRGCGCWAATPYLDAEAHAMALAVRAEAERLGAVCLAACARGSGPQHPLVGKGLRGQCWCWEPAPEPEVKAHTMAIAVRAEAEGLGAGCLSPAARGPHPGLQHPPWGLACRPFSPGMLPPFVLWMEPRHV